MSRDPGDPGPDTGDGTSTGDPANDQPTRGGAFYDDPEVLERYLAHRHRAVYSPNLVMEEPAFLRAAGDLAGARILDLGCGDGELGRSAIAAGAAAYTGLDGSARMVERARAGWGDVAADRARIVHGDLEDLATAAGIGGPFDLITARMVLHYLADPAPVLRAVRDRLAPDGRFVASVVHPVITAHDAGTDGPRTSWTVDDYFVPGPRHRTWFGSTVTWHHRTIEQHLAALADAGLRLETLSEARPEPERFGPATEEYERRRRVPLFLVLAAVPT